MRSYALIFLLQYVFGFSLLVCLLFAQLVRLGIRSLVCFDLFVNQLTSFLTDLSVVCSFVGLFNWSGRRLRRFPGYRERWRINVVMAKCPSWYDEHE